MDQISIRGDVDKEDAQVCRFTVDRPVVNGTATFTSKEEAGENNLAQKLFNIPGITQVELADNVVTIKKNSHDAWNVIGKRIGGSIRSFLQPPPAVPEGDILPPAVIRERVQRMLDEMINPNLASHGGFVELLDVENNNIYVRMGGGCQGCGAADMTMKMGIERMIRDEIPQIGEVLDVTDHAAGTNPYYSPAK
ncbi:MAG TPA: NifU family protein [Blastocatellia bacterium]|nr:NifU family protein [Blastocatellia bacterium]